MNDDFNRALWDMAKDSPQLQKAIIKSMSKDSGGYSIPVGDITEAIFADGREAYREKLIQAIKNVRELKVKDLARIIAELRVALIAEEATGKELQPCEKTLKDIDPTALAVFALVKWMAYTKKEGKR